MSMDPADLKRISPEFPDPGHWSAGEVPPPYSDPPAPAATTPVPDGGEETPADDDDEGDSA